MKKHGKGFLGVCKGAFSGLWGKQPPQKNVEQIYSKGAAIHSPEKQKKLEALCEGLFAQKKLITTGKLQLIGLTKIKRKLGKMWVGLQPIVYTEVEEAISKYMMPKDIFIRYKDESYVVIFADAGPEEAQIKATLIAEEIKRRLFEHEEEELNNIDVENSITVIKTDKLKVASGLSDVMDIVSKETEVEIKKVSTPSPPVENKPFKMPQAIEVDPYNNKKEPAEEKQEKLLYSSLKFSYVPLWDIRKNLLTTYLCVANEGLSEGDPLDAHELVFRGASPSEKARIDLLVLQKVAKELDAMAQDGRKLYVACPVHYDTLSRTENYEKYIVECQKIPQDQKRFLVFVLLGLPAKTHAANIPKFSIPLKQHCFALHAQVPLDMNVDFSLFRESRFDAIGVRLKKVKGSEKQLLAQLEIFTRKAKEAFIQNTFVLDVSSLSITTSSVCAGFDFLAGPSIHASVSKPDSVYHFKHESLFTNLLEK